MKHYRFFLITIIALLCSSSGFGQTFDPQQFTGRTEFFKYVKLSESFHSADKRKCNTLNSKFVVWHYADTLLFNLKKTRVFYHDNHSDSIRLETVFTKKDYDYIINQFNYYRDKSPTWEACYTWRLIKVKPDNRTSIPYWEFSQPLYSSDHDKCLIKMNYYKKESDYIISTVLFYKNDKGKWIEKAVIDMISPGMK